MEVFDQARLKIVAVLDVGLHVRTQAPLSLSGVDEIISPGRAVLPYYELEQRQEIE